MFNKSKPHDFKYKLGQEVIDQVTGFKGVIVCRSQWLTNCNTYGVKPRSLDNDGKPMSTEHFDEPMLALVSDKPLYKERRSTGGPTEPPVQTNR